MTYETFSALEQEEMDSLIQNTAITVIPGAPVEEPKTFSMQYAEQYALNGTVAAQGSFVRS